MGSALVEEATRRSGVVWLLADGQDPQLVWHTWHAGAALVVHGGREQPLLGVRDHDRVLVIVRSAERQADRVVQWQALVQRVAPGTELWDELAPVLHRARLNAPDGDAQPARWARESTLLRLVPTGREQAVDRAPG